MLTLFIVGTIAILFLGVGVVAKTIHRLKIKNFKSIDSLEINGLAPFSVFAGPNGSGKSNFFDALSFVSTFIVSGIELALRAHGGYDNIRSAKLLPDSPHTFSLEISCALSNLLLKKSVAVVDYSLSIHDLDSTPTIEESLSIDGNEWLARKGKEIITMKLLGRENTPFNIASGNHSALPFFLIPSLTTLLSNIRLYRIDPLGAAAPSLSDQDPSLLDRKGRNLARVLNRMERNEDLRETILDLMQMIVPGIEGIQTAKQEIDSSTAILFKEAGTARRFPAHMVSDGTVYALSLLVAVLDAKEDDGIILIEEPERGLHPKAIQALIDLIRDKATPNRPIWLTTHSESVVRRLRLEELVLVDKQDGRTVMKSCDSGNITLDSLAPLGLDEAWLSNLLNGGVPW